MARILRGSLVRLTNPNYPGVDYTGTLVEGPAAGEVEDGYYGTYTLTTEDGHKVRSEGVLTQVYDPEMAERLAIQADAENERDGYKG